ncbi:hypothetical protein ACOMHN_046559 [Nucella lapillus]
MSKTTPTKDFHWADYVVFGAVLAISAAIGLFAAFKHRKATAEQLLTGNRKLPILPVAMSLTASFLSAVTVLGLPLEVYVNNTEYWLTGLGLIVGALINAFVFMPVIYRLRLTSAYQYLEFRFSRTVRILGSLTFVLLMMMYMAIVMYAPALALSQVTGLSLEISILTTGLICTLYTALGGIKAVVWTDTFQTLVIMAGFLTMIVRGTITVGGWGVVMDRAFEGKRFTWDLDLNPDPFVRHTFWTLVIGSSVLSLSVYAANQAMLQRYISVSSINRARWAILCHIPMSQLFLALGIVTGMVIYAFYYGCDPLTRRLVSKPDQLVPYFVMDLMGHLPGLPGLFVACVYSAALSTVSSGVNSLAAVMLEDFFRPCLKKTGKESERLKSIITIVSALVFGLVTIGLAYLAGELGQTILQVALSIYGMVGGPLLGLMLLGMLCPCINSWGAGSALVCSLAVSLWTGIGAVLNPAPRFSDPSSQPLSIAMCNLSGGDPASNYSSPTTTVSPSLLSAATSAMSTDAAAADTTTTAGGQGGPDSWGLDQWYRLSYQYYALLSVIVSIVVGLLVSALTDKQGGRGAYCQRGRLKGHAHFQRYVTI